MCKSPLHELLAQLPKCEHHVHIEGTLTPRMLFQLARRNNVQLPPDDPTYESEQTLLARFTRFSSLDDFLSYYYRGMSVLVTQQDFEDVTYAYLQRAHEDGVVHAELSFDPQAHLSRASFETVIEGIDTGRKRAERDFSISTAIIMCFLRHLGQRPALDLFHSTHVQKYLNDRTVTGIGLDSSENGYPPELFCHLYEKARSVGLRLTAHAGEEGPVDNIKKSLELLNCERVDHGVRLAEDAELMQLVALSSTLLTVCPLSNVYLRCFDSVEKVPVRQFLEAGIHFSINSDDPAYLGGFILENYCAVQDAFCLNVGEWKRICTASIEGSWCSAEKKDWMQLKLDQVLAKFERAQDGET